jgi:hypothetical protein
MKKSDLFKKLSEQTKIDVETLTKALTSDQEEIEIEFPEVHVFTQEELNTRDLNTAKAGNKAAVEIAIKHKRDELKEKYGDEFDFQGKTMENLIEAAIKAGKKEAGVKPNEQLIEKEKVIKNLQETVTKLEQEKNDAVSNMTQFEFNYKVDSTLIKKVPQLENSPFSADEYITLWKKDHSPVLVDGVLTFKKNGEIARDPKTQTPITIESGFETWFNEKGLMGQQRQGRGEGDDKRGGTGLKHSDIKSGSDYYKYVEEQKLGTTEKVKLLNEIMKENPQFELDK